ncbi:GNAT family N-acetyltransferase [Paenibacillus sp. FSL A5-0031]|uniref:GNAT family N-acetyltransferase n=1 Tax=Paenibacillus sp. FSL A5-0031 TaxID=1920420 RepID=UPI00096CFDB4|nr:GNAT family N-acetyltransferase [Paenibacillus sp. FSL A5-0031]OME77727.1 GNAT family N-acetyltransferase [Paenibacillus sp. FSL A5-0031]
MIRKIDITDAALAEEVLHIQIPSYRVEAELIDFYEIPPLKDTVDTLRNCGETFYGYYINNELCGAIAIMIENNIIDIHRLIIHPNHFRKGIAKQLLQHIESVGVSGSVIVVSTGSKNAPAVNLYKQSGYVETGVIEVEERLSLTSFQKILN